MKKSDFRHILCFLLCALTLFLIAAIPTRVAPESETFFSVDAEKGSTALPEGSGIRLAAEATQAGIHLTATGDDPHLHYVLDTSSDLISLTLAKPVQTLPVLHLAVDGKWDEAVAVSGVAVAEDEDSVTYAFYTPAGNCATYYAFRMGGDFTLVSIRHEAVGEGLFYRLNLPALLLFVLVFGALVLLAHKLHLFEDIKARFRLETARIKTLSCKKRILYLLCIGILGAFVLTAFADLALSLTFPVMTVLLWILAALSVIALLLLGLYLREDISFSKLFFLVVTVVGTAFALSIPPTLLLSWDDEYHFAHMAFPGGFLSGGDASMSAQNLISARPHYSNFFADSENFASALLAMDGIDYRIVIPEIPVHPLLLIPAAPFALVYAAFRYLVYLPGILVCALGFLLNTDIILITTVCRLCTLLVFVTAFTLGIRRLVYGKHLFAVCALLPCTLFLAVNFSCDSFISAFIALGVAYFIGELQRPDEPLTLRNAIVMLAALTVGCGPKAIYFVLFLPLLFLPKKKFTSPRAARIFRLCVLGLMFFVFLTILAPFFIGSGYTDNRGGSDVNATEQIKYILSNPFVYLRDLLRFLAGYVGLPNAVVHLNFYAYMPSGSSLFSSAYVLLALLLAMADRRRDDGTDLSLSPLLKSVSLLTVFATICLVATSLYVGYTPVGASTVNGCQFRYIFPLIPISLYFLTSVRMRSYIGEKSLALLSLGAGSAINLVLIYESLIRHTPLI